MRKPQIDNLRASLRSFLKLSPSFCPTDVSLVPLGVLDGCRRSALRYTAADGEPIEAFLFEPIDNEPRGAVLALHQHNSQWEIGKSEIAGLAGDPHQAFGPVLARNGVTVIAPDAIGFESRMQRAGWGKSLAPVLQKPRSTPESWLQYYNQMAHRLVTGDLLMRKILDDCSTALSVLSKHTGNLRPGVLGHSFGGLITLFLTAVDVRVAYACSSGAVCSYRCKLSNGTALEMALVIPGFLAHYDIEDLLRCVAPRPMLVVSSEDDPQAADADDVVSRVRDSFESQGCTTNLQHLRTAGPHALDESRFEALVDWTVRQAIAS